MANQTSKNIRLGAMVIAGTALLIIALYVIGDKQNLFGSTFRISAYFQNVNGLMVGHNVRFDGIDVGTVKNIEIINDTTVKVDMAIELESQKFIHKNALASIGTDGLMGNKLVNITPTGVPSPQVEEGDILKTSEPLEADDALRTLTQTNADIAVIVSNLRTFTDQMSSPNSVWSVLTDTAASENIKAILVNIKQTSSYTALVAAELNAIVSDVQSGKGTLGALITDSTIATELNQTAANIQLISDSLVYFTADLQSISDRLLSGEGTLSTLLNDTTLAVNLTETIQSARNGASDFEESMKALQDNFLVRHYFKKKNKMLEKERKHID
ncbi:MAG: MCE family protein [Bacteroidetes bacterium]|nr:MCE family protein [Bacteroidota bacterium]